MSQCAGKFYFSAKLKRLTPDCINIKIKGKNLRCQKTIDTATQYRLNQEIKFLYIKKSKLNEQLYVQHLECAYNWRNVWPTILQSIDQKLPEEMDSHYNKLNRKLDALQSKHKDKNRNRTKEGQIQHHFYARTVNLTKIKFSKEETDLLNQGLQHSTAHCDICWLFHRIRGLLEKYPTVFFYANT